MEDPKVLKDYIDSIFEKEFSKEKMIEYMGEWPEYVDYDKLKEVKYKEIREYILEAIEDTIEDSEDTIEDSEDSIEDSEDTQTVLFPTEKSFILGFNGLSMYTCGTYVECLERDIPDIPLEIIKMYKEGVIV